MTTDHTIERLKEQMQAVAAHKEMPETPGLHLRPRGRLAIIGLRATSGELHVVPLNAAEAELLARALLDIALDDPDLPEFTRATPAALRKKSRQLRRLARSVAAYRFGSWLNRIIQRLQGAKT